MSSYTSVSLNYKNYVVKEETTQKKNTKMRTKSPQ